MEKVETLVVPLPMANPSIPRTEECLEARKRLQAPWDAISKPQLG
jgi:hypothetical protein